ncbi:hypothetical protein H1R20_g15754, partial [Candolleomyces eurysporus]
MEYVVGPNSREYWNNECTKVLDEYQCGMSTENHKAFRSAVKAAKREFFDKRIEEVATTNKRPWDLMEWVKERKNPPCEAIQFEGRPCHNLGDLWDALHSTYNTASDRPVDVSLLEELPEEPERPVENQFPDCRTPVDCLAVQTRPWPVFSQLELRQALEACSARSAPGPDHITWRHLKQILALPECGEIIIALANGCMESGYWPRHFKESMSVIIPKPNKPSYSAPKAFRPIVLLNTLGKLIEKMISNRFQHDMIKFDLVDPNPMGGVRQRSTEDAGLFLTHLVPTTPEDITRAAKASPYKQWWNLTSAPRIVPESKASTSATVFFNLWDSTTGTTGNALINKRILIFNKACTISAASANPGVPLCNNCWVWGHPTEACRSSTRCKVCAGPHRESEHRRLCGLCKGNAKAKPPVPPTPAGDACPHRYRCLACRRDNCSVTSGKCPFWNHRFDRDWIAAKYAELKKESETRGRG